MKSTDFSPQFSEVWGEDASSGTITYPIPATTTTSGRAALGTGFTSVNMTPIAAGGIPPFGQDFNGILKMLSTSAQNYESGNVPVWSSDMASNVSGYPQYALVQYEGTYYVSTADGNITTPGATDASWKSLFDGYATETWVNGTLVTGTTGYEIKPNGKIEQWGTYTTGETGLVTVYFPLPFPNSCDNIGVNEANATGTWTVNTPTLHGVNQAPNNSAFIANVRIWSSTDKSWGAGNATGYWRAIGH